MQQYTFTVLDLDKMIAGADDSFIGNGVVEADSKDEAIDKAHLAAEDFDVDEDVSIFVEVKKVEPPTY